MITLDLKTLAKLSVTTDSLFGDLSGITKAHVICEQLGQPFDITKAQQVLLDFERACQEFEATRQSVETAKQVIIDKQVAEIAEQVKEVLNKNLAVQLPNGDLVRFDSEIVWSCLWGAGFKLKSVDDHRTVGKNHGKKIQIDARSSFKFCCSDLAKMILDKTISNVGSESGRRNLVLLFQHVRRGIGFSISCGAYGVEDCSQYGRCNRVELPIVQRKEAR